MKPPPACCRLALCLGSAWLSRHFREHHAFGRDEKILRDRAWPIMKGAAGFCLDWLIDDSKGHLVTAPFTSPELNFKTANGNARASARRPRWTWP